jgi:hypothetical protein
MSEMMMHKSLRTVEAREGRNVPPKMRANRTIRESVRPPSRRSLAGNGRGGEVIMSVGMKRMSVSAAKEAIADVMLYESTLGGCRVHCAVAVVTMVVVVLPVSEGAVLGVNHMAGKTSPTAMAVATIETAR